MVTEHKLKNGFTVWINEDFERPVVYGGVVVKAGSKHSPDTGIPHYFEHIMFKGTDKIGTIDYEAEKVYLDSIAAKYDELAVTKNPEDRLNIQREINRLSIKSAEYIIPNEFDKLISQYGGTGLNAFTSFDITAYFNEFSPGYFRQWAEINSERLINPVFRMFQSELETVYEEKNMYADRLGNQAFEHLLNKFFKPHPYRYPILGSAENLKNPQLSRMNEFFDSYYVAGNMGLILSGAIKTEEVLPVIEETFGRIKPGVVPSTVLPKPGKINGIEKVEVKIPVPFVKIQALAWRGVPENHPDALTLDIMTRLLSNEHKTGYIDKLVVGGKLMESAILHMELQDAGLLGVGILPKLPFQSKSKAQKMVMNEINRIKKGDFSEAFFESIKLEKRKSLETDIEKIQNKVRIMFNLFAKGLSWDDYLSQLKALEKLTKEDIVKIANVYLTGDYFEVNKKTGNYPKDKLVKPPFKPIVPKNTEARSEYARQLEKIEISNEAFRFIDFDKDSKCIELKPNLNLYMTSNPVNEVFTLKLRYSKGSLEEPDFAVLAEYLNLLGTKQQPFDDFKNQLQVTGSKMDFICTGNSLSLNISGFENKFEETVSIIAGFMSNVKPDMKKLKIIKSSIDINVKTRKESPELISDAMFEKVCFGEKSTYLNLPAKKDLKRFTDDYFDRLMDKLKNQSCEIHYCGNKNEDIVRESIEKNSEQFGFDKISEPSANPVYRKNLPVDKTVVYFFNMPKSNQSVVLSYIPGNINESDKERNSTFLFNSYFGQGMGSIIFQEIREFRSFAYSAGASYNSSSYKHRDKPGYFKASLSTQGDKTVDAMLVLDSLLQHMPVKADRITSVKQDLINQLTNGFPSFREISHKIAYYKEAGYSEDPNKLVIEGLDDLSMEDIVSFQEKNIRGKPVAYIVVGNKKRIDMEQLSRFGKIIEVREKDIFK
jgi:predicted Zn-dependent peptidase